MSSLQNSIKANILALCIVTFAGFNISTLSAKNIAECSHNHNCKHHDLSTKVMERYDKKVVLNFSKIIKSEDIEALIGQIPTHGREYRLRTVVLDAGHGGKDAGCSGKDSKEKNLTLEYVLALGTMISEKYPEIHVVYTRKSDEFVELYERANIANKNKADLFISIHCNWNPNSTPYGTETYVLGLHRAKDNLEVAKRENSSIFLENNYEKNYDGFDPNSPEGNILLSMCQNAHLTQSISLAEKIEKEFAVKSQRKSRGVRQAGFLVLRATSMPAILVETGFLSNGAEEDYMTGTKGKKQIVQNIFSGFEKYKAAVEFSADEPLANIQTNKAPELESDEDNESVASNVQPEPSKALEKKQIKTINENPPLYKESKPEQSSHKPNTEYNNGKIEICVQLQVSKNVLDMTEPRWTPFKNIIARSESDLLKYQVVCTSLQEAGKIKAQARQLGFPDAFVCAYKGGNRISLDDLNAEGKIGSR